MITKFCCKECGKEVPVRDMEQIIEWNKTCADCRVKDVTGGIKPKAKPYFKKKVETYTGPLRKEDKKKVKKKSLTDEQRKNIQIAHDAKWDRERYGMRNAYYKEHNIDFFKD